MIDFNTYRQMHPSKSQQPLASNAEMREQGVDMGSDDPPSEPFCILLPPTILGYGFHDKKWSENLFQRPSVCKGGSLTCGM
jgi:hypothetical protein